MGRGQERCAGSPSPSAGGRIQPLPAATFQQLCSTQRGANGFRELEKVAF